MTNLKYFAVLIVCFGLHSCTTSSESKVKQSQVHGKANQGPIAFFVMGSNQGSGIENPGMKAIVDHANNGKPEFGLGVGNHLGDEGRTQFADVMGRFGWWRSRFFPALSSGENIAYGSSKSDWGAAAKFLHRNQLLANSQSISMGARRWMSPRSPFRVSYNQRLLNGDGDPLDYRLEYSKNGMKIIVFHVYSFDRGPKIASVDKRSLDWLDQELAGLKKSRQSYKTPPLVVLITHGGGASNWLESDLAAAYTPRIFEQIDAVFLSQRSNDTSAIKVNRRAHASFAAYKPLVVEIPDLNGEDALILDAKVLKHPTRLVTRFIDLKEGETLWNKGAYVKTLGGSESRLTRIDSLEDWQKELKR